MSCYQFISLLIQAATGAALIYIGYMSNQISKRSVDIMERTERNEKIQEVVKDLMEFLRKYQGKPTIEKIQGRIKKLKFNGYDIGIIDKALSHLDAYDYNGIDLLILARKEMEKDGVSGAPGQT